MILQKIYRNLIVLFKPLTVHTEAIILDEIWEIAREKALSGKIKTWYVMTPANYEFTKVFLNLKITKKEFEKKMKERYLWLLSHNQKLGLHIHLNPIMNISYSEQEKLFRESLEWMKKELNLNVTEFVPGWWKYNEDTLKILRKNNLKLVKPTDFKSIHDFDWLK